MFDTKYGLEASSISGRAVFLVLTTLLLSMALLSCEGDSDKQTAPEETDGDSANADGDSFEAEEEDSFVADPTGFFFGYGETDITPPDGTILGGFGAPGGYRKTTGVHDPLLVQVALFTNDAGESFMIIAMDCAGYFYEFGEAGPGVRELRQRLSEDLDGQVKIDAEHILVTTSHSHAATDLVGFWQRIGEGIPEELLLWHVERISEAAMAAAEDLKEAQLFLAESELTGLTGRDGPCSEINDDTVSVLQVTDPEGKVRLTMVNWAKHPTIAPERNTLASADFILGYRDTIEEATQAPGIFLQGFVAAVHDGDGMNDLKGEDYWETAHNVGRVLAETTLLALQEKHSADSFDIRHRHTVYSCKGEGDYLTDAYGMFGMPKRTVREEPDGIYIDTLEVSWHKLGPAEFATFPGEGSPEYSLRLRAEMESPGRFIIGLGNDSVGYIIDPESIEADNSGQLEGYELKMGLGMPMGPATWNAMESLGWFKGAYLEEPR